MIQRKVIAVDFDEVLFPFVDNFLSFYNSKFGTSFNRDHMTHYTFTHLIDKSMEEIVDHIFDYFFNTDSHSHNPIEESKKHVHELAYHHDLVIVTARQFELEDLTTRWINKHFPGVFKDIRLCNSYGPKEPMLRKVDACTEINADVLIDDALQNVTDCAEAGIETFLYDAGYMWNQTDVLPEKVTRVKSWAEVRNKLI